MVSVQPPHGDIGAISNIVFKAPWSLPLLWYSVQYADARTGVSSGTSGMASLVRTSASQWLYFGREIQIYHWEDVSATASEDCPLILKGRLWGCKVMPEEPYELIAHVRICGGIGQVTG